MIKILEVTEKGQRHALNMQKYRRYLAEADFAQSESVLWHLRVAEGDHLSERSEGGKLPKRKTRALATHRKLITPLRGCFGGDARGAEKGA